MSLFCFNPVLVIPKRLDVCVETACEFSMWKQTGKHRQTGEPSAGASSTLMFSHAYLRVPLVVTWELS